MSNIIYILALWQDIKRCVWTPLNIPIKTDSPDFWQQASVKLLKLLMKDICMPKKIFWHFGEMLNWDKLLYTFMRTYLSKSSLEWDWIYQILRLIISDNHDFWRQLQACACIRISFFVSLIWSNPTPYQSRQPWLLKATWSSLYFQIGIDVNTSLLYFPLPLPIQSTFDVKAALKRLLFKTIIKIMILFPETVG